MSSSCHPKASPLALLLLRTVISSVALTLMVGWTVVGTDSQADNTVIAYVSTSTDNQEIRLINPDGTQDRSLWRIPSISHPSNGIGTLSWHPDGTELLFDSGYNSQRSLAIRDLYAIWADGSVLRRITSPPGPEGYDRYPTGTVTFLLDASESGDVQLYITGASEPIDYFARRYRDYQITQTIADLGEGVRQQIRLWDPETYSYSCSFSEEGWVDVVPGEVTDFGIIHFSFNDDMACPRYFSPTCSHNGSHILYLSREPTTSMFPVNNLWQISANATINTLGTRLLNMNNYSLGTGKLYRAVIAPTAAQAPDEILFLQQEPSSDNILYATTANAASYTSIDLDCQFCDTLDIAWLPDGSGFIVAQKEWTVKGGTVKGGTVKGGTVGVLYRHTFADEKLIEIIRLPNEVIGKLAIAPDNSSIVFERGPALKDTVDKASWGPQVQCPCELWLVNSDGSNLRQLANDGRAPAWSLGALTNEAPEPITDNPPPETETPESVTNNPLPETEAPEPVTNNPPETVEPAPQVPPDEGGGGGAITLLDGALLFFLYWFSVGWSALLVKLGK